jgi:hypothetical protein
LWEIRGELFADGFEEELIASYQPRGQEPCPPALLAMVMLLQRYDGISDADAVGAAENDLRWQLVLGTLGKELAPFGQGTLVRFRLRMLANDLDKRLVDRTVALAKKSKKFGWKKLRVALDSSPLHGAGRVEDTWNLIGRAMSKVVHAVSLALDIEEDRVIKQAGLTVLSADSIKAAIDIDWDDDDAEHAALQRLLKRSHLWKPGLLRERPKQRLYPHSKARLRFYGKSSGKTSSQTLLTGIEFVTVLPRIGSSRSVISKCVTGERAARSNSTATSDTSRSPTD